MLAVKQSYEQKAQEYPVGKKYQTRIFAAFYPKALN